MKKLTRSALTLVLAMVLAVFSSCTDKKTTELAGVMGDDAYVMAFIKPVDIIQNCGATIEDGKLVLPNSFKRLIGKGSGNLDISKLQGIDYELVGYALYEKAPYAVGMCNVKNAEDFAASLKKLDFDKEKVDGHVVFVNEDKGLGVLVTGNIGVLFEYWDEERLDDAIEKITERASEPMAAWKADLMAKRASNAIYGLVVSPKSSVDLSVAFSVAVSGERLTAETESFDLDGKSITWATPMLDDVELATLGKEMTYISKDCLYGYAFAGLKDMSLAKFLDKYGDLIPNSRQISAMGEDYLKALNGGFFMSVDMADPSSRRYDNYKNYNVSAGVTTVDDRGERLLKDVVSMARDYGLTVRSEGDGYTVKIPEMGSATVECTDGIIHAEYGEAGKSHMSSSSADDCIAWMGVNIPENFGMLKEFRISYGLKGELRVKASTAELQLEVLGSDKPFLETLIDVLQRVN